MYSIFLKNKKHWLLFFLFFFILIPEITQGWGFLEVCGWGEWLRFPATTFWCALMWIFTALIKVIFMAFFAIFTTLLMVIASIYSAGVYMLSTSLIPLLSVPILGSPIVTEMWTFVRDFANMFFILFFVVIGLSTILRVEAYKYQKTLPLLIIMALLMNFSLVFVGLIVDIGNILTGIFLESVQGGIMRFNEILSYQVNILSNGLGAIWNASWANPINSITIAVGWIAYALALAGVYSTILCVFFVIIFIFIFRIAILWILAILSPLAFVSYVFQNTRTFIWGRWLTNLVKWSIVAVPILFFMFIALKILHSAPQQLDLIFANMPPDEVTGGRITQLITAAMIPIISVIIMQLGVIISMTSLPEAAQSAINAGKSTGSLLTNTAKGVVRKIPIVSKGEAKLMKGLESNALGRMFVGPRGTYDKKLSGDKKAHKELIETLDKKALIKGLNDFGNSPSQKAAYMEVLAGKGAITNDIFDKNMNAAEQGGVDRMAILQNVPLKTKDEEEFQKLMSKMTSEGISKISAGSLDPNNANTQEDKDHQFEIIKRVADSGYQGQKKIAHESNPELKKAIADNVRLNYSAYQAPGKDISQLKLDKLITLGQ